MKARALAIPLALLLAAPTLAAPDGKLENPAELEKREEMAAKARPQALRGPETRGGPGRAWWGPVADRGWLGVRLSTKPQLEQALKLDVLPDEWLAVHNTDWLAEEWDGAGSFVLQVFPDTPAERAGLLPGDVILSFNGIRTRSPGELAFITQRCIVGHDALLEVLRDGEERIRLVEVGLHPEDARRLKEEEEARRRQAAEDDAAKE